MEDLARRLAEALRDVLVTDPDMPSWPSTEANAEAVLQEAVAAGLIKPDDD